MIELYQLEHLLAIAAHGTMKKAAEELPLSQSALSRSIQRLEEELKVTLFHRQKNRVTMNPNGELAVEYARKVLAQMDELVAHVRAFDRSRHTISVGSCAPAPLWDISPLLSALYPDMTIACDLKEPDQLRQGLSDGTYQIIVLPFKIQAPDFFTQEYGTERLFFSLPPGHPMSDREELYFGDLDGETMLLYSHIGFWHQLHMSKMPSTRFLMQDERFTFNELVKSSALPSFISDIVIKREGMPPNRAVIPIADPEATVTYYCMCRREDQKVLTGLFERKEAGAKRQTPSSTPASGHLKY